MNKTLLTVACLRTLTNRNLSGLIIAGPYTFPISQQYSESKRSIYCRNYLRKQNIFFSFVVNKKNTPRDNFKG